MQKRIYAVVRRREDSVVWLTVPWAGPAAKRPVHHEAVLRIRDLLGEWQGRFVGDMPLRQYLAAWVVQRFDEEERHAPL